MELRERIVTYLVSELRCPEEHAAREAHVDELLKQDFSDCEDLVMDFLDHAFKDIHGQLPDGYHVSGMDYPELSEEEQVALWEFVYWVDENVA